MLFLLLLFFALFLFVCLFVLVCCVNVLFGNLLLYNPSTPICGVVCVYGIGLMLRHR